MGAIIILLQLVDTIALYNTKQQQHDLAPEIISATREMLDTSQTKELVLDQTHRSNVVETVPQHMVQHERYLKEFFKSKAIETEHLRDKKINEALKEIHAMIDNHTNIINEANDKQIEAILQKIEKLTENNKTSGAVP